MAQEGIAPSCNPFVSPPKQDVIHRLCSSTKLRKLNYELLSFEAFSKSIRKWRESTSTSPVGHHLGH